jgi:hypothetical protein
MEHFHPRNVGEIEDADGRGGRQSGLRRHDDLLY